MKLWQKILSTWYKNQKFDGSTSDAFSVALYCKHCTDLKWAWKANRLNPRPLGGATCQGWEMQRTEVSMQNLFARNLLWITRVKEFCDLTKKFQRDNAKFFHSDICSRVFISQSKFWLHLFMKLLCFFQFSVFRNLDFMVFFFESFGYTNESNG